MYPSIFLGDNKFDTESSQAVEPVMEVDKSPKKSGIKAFLPVIGAAGLAVLSLPLLPLLFEANPDQA